jgi:glycosyltransferase involved in cell wall biosynthesis
VVASITDKTPGKPRLLVITYHFPPDGSVGGLRWSGLSKYLARQGWEVHVVTASPATGQEDIPGRYLHSCTPNHTINDFYNRVARRIRAVRGSIREKTGPGAPAAKSASPAALVPNADATRGLNPLTWMRTSIASWMSFPDYGRGWIIPAARKARSLMERHAFDVIVSSGPPHSAHLAATLACRDDPRRLWIDMRDPWAALLNMSWSLNMYNSAATRRTVRMLERLVFNRARGIITNTPEFAREVRASYPDLDVAYISNGIDRERLPAPATTKFDGLSIAYAGTLYLSRDLSPVIRAMHLVVESCPELRAELKLRVAGSMDGPLKSKLESEVARAGLEETVEVRGRVLATEAMDMINRSHLALVLAQDQPTQIPAKLYECVAVGVRTLVIAEPHSAAAHEATRLGADTLDASDVTGIAKLIEEVCRNRDSRFTPRVDIGYEAIAAQMDDVLREAPSVLPAGAR